MNFVHSSYIFPQMNYISTMTTTESLAGVTKAEPVFKDKKYQKITP